MKITEDMTQIGLGMFGATLYAVSLIVKNPYLFFVPATFALGFVLIKIKDKFKDEDSQKCK
jgi:hypothetical protein